MPLDPNIPLSFQPPQLPDYNALVQQRGQNMANMMTMQNAIEDRQAGQQAAQDAAMQKALSPALAAAFTNPSDEGLAAAFDLVPDQYKDAAQEQLAQLQAIPDVNIRKSVLRTGLAQYDFGKIILQQVEPSANMALQAKTAEQRAAIDQQRLALDQAKLDAEAAGGGKIVQWVTDDAGNVTGLNAQGAIVATQPGIGKKTAQATTPEGMDAKTKTKLDQAYPKASQSLQSATTSLDQDVADVEALLADPGLKDITGLFGANTPNIGAAARRAQALYDKIKSGAGFAALQNMRLSSPTGGALGNVSNQEGSKLEQSVAAFSQAQNYDDLRNALRTYLVDLKVAKDNLLGAFDETYSYRGENPSAPLVSRATKARKRLESTTPMPGKTALPPGVTVRKN